MKNKSETPFMSAKESEDFWREHEVTRQTTQGCQVNGGDETAISRLCIVQRLQKCIYA